MKKINVLLLLILNLLLSNVLTGQELLTPITNRLTQASIIFEGTVILSTPYYDASGIYINTSNTIEITKIFKGSVSCGTIEMITKGGVINGEGTEYFHSLEVIEGSSGIFLCENTTAPISIIDFYPETNINVLEPQFGVQSFIRYWWDGEELNASDINLNYDSLALVYSTVVASSGLAFIDCNQTAQLKLPNIDPFGFAIGETNEMPNYNSKKNREIINRMIEKVAISKAYRSGEEVTFRMKNFTITGVGNGISYLEFDVSIKDNVGVNYLSSAGIRLEYGALTFGSNVVSNQKIEVTRLGLVLDTNCYHNVIVTDENNPQVVTIYIGEQLGANCRSQVLTSEQGLFHIKMLIDNCNMIWESINLQDTASISGGSSMVADMTSFVTTPNLPPSLISYQTVVHSQVKNMVSCDPLITNFDPLSVVGGVKDILTITGKRFRSDMGKVYFPNADDGGSSFVWTDSLDIISWTDTLIKLYVPSHSQGNYFSTAQTNQKAGSGGFKIVNSGYKTCYSNQALEIRTTLFNTAKKGTVFITPHAAYNGQFEFHCTQALAAYKNGDAKVIIQKAIDDWACLTGIYWTLGSDIAYLSDSSLADGINVIQFSPYLKSNEVAIGSQKVMQTAAGQYGWARELDIEINVNKNFFCDTTGATIPPGETDLYAAILHELGHCHGIGHVNGANEIMSYITSGTRKIDLENDLSCDEGGSRILWMSTLLPTATLTAITASKIIVNPNPPCTHYVGIFENNKHIFELLVYPNPVGDKLNINIKSEINTEVLIELFDVSGRLVHRVVKTLYVGDNTLLVDTNYIAKGMYFLNVSSGSNGRIMSTKVVKE